MTHSPTTEEMLRLVDGEIEGCDAFAESTILSEEDEELFGHDGQCWQAIRVRVEAHNGFVALAEAVVEHFKDTDAPLGRSAKSLLAAVREMGQQKATPHD